MPRFTLPVLLFTAFIGYSGVGVLLPTLPFVIRSYGYDATWVGWVFSAYFAGMFLWGVSLGKLSDIYGRRRILFFAIAINLLGYGMFACAYSILLLIIACLCSGFGGAGSGPVVRTYVSAISRPEERTHRIGLTSAMAGLGYVVGPLIPALLANASFSVISLAASILIAIDATLIGIVLVEPPALGHAHPTDTSWFFSFGEHTKIIHIILMTTTIGFLGYSAMQATLALSLHDRFAVSPAQVGWYFMWNGIVYMCYQIFIIRRIRRVLDEWQMTLLGLGLLCAGFGIFAFNPYLFLVPIIAPLFTVGFGTISTTTASLTVHFAGRHAGRALGINSSGICIGAFIGVAVASHLYLIAPSIPYIFSSFLFLVMIGVTMRHMQSVPVG